MKTQAVIQGIKKHPILAVCICFFLPLLIVHLIFKWHSGISFFEAEWTAGDIITYIAGFEAFIGTVFLGTVAIKQNETIVKLQENEDTTAQSCSILLRGDNFTGESVELSNECEAFSESGNSNQLVFVAHNYSSPFLMKIRIYNDKYNFISHLTLAQNQEKVVIVPLPECSTTKYKVEYFSCYGVSTFGSFELEVQVAHKFRISEYHFYGTEAPTNDNT